MSRRPLIEARDDQNFGEAVSGPGYIPGALSALTKMLKHDVISNEQLNARLRPFKNQVVDQIVATAWRYIALKPSSAKDATPKVLIEIIDKYVLDQNID